MSEANRNATQGELEELNGLLVRELIAKIREGVATSTDLGTAMNLIRSNQVKPRDPEAEAFEASRSVSYDDFPIQYPIDVDDEA